MEPIFRASKNVKKARRIQDWGQEVGSNQHESKARIDLLDESCLKLFYFKDLTLIDLLHQFRDSLTNNKVLS